MITAKSAAFFFIIAVTGHRWNHGLTPSKALNAGKEQFLLLPRNSSSLQIPVTAIIKAASSFVIILCAIYFTSLS